MAIGRQGICPDGWHVPSDVEINILEKELFEQNTAYSSFTQNFTQSWNKSWNTSGGGRGINDTTDNGDGHGKVFLAPCTPTTNGSNLDYTSGRSNTIVKNGFYAIPTGWGNIGISYKFGERAYFWSSSGAGRDTARPQYFLASCRYVFTQNQPHLVFRGNARHDELLPIRCKKS